METYIILFIILLIAVWNADVIKWYTTKKQHFARFWHGIGFVIRGLLVLVIFLTSSNWFIVWISVIVSWHLYDIIINVIRDMKWYHTGENIFDRSPYCWIAKGLVLLIGILFFIINI